jgi:mono/diheme cytochrome c family protein
MEAREDAAGRGEYLVNLLGCGRCHTEGYLLGNNPTGPHLAGSRVGIAYTDRDDGGAPGLVFAPNLTPDDQTGLGTWSRRDIVRALITGVGTDGHQRLPVMPWPNYAALTDADLLAVASYLQSLPAVKRQIPDTTAAGAPVAHPYVRFGIYVFTPFDGDAAHEDEPQSGRQL